MTSVTRLNLIKTRTGKERFPRKGAKTQRKTVETRQRFAALREKSAQGSRTFSAKPVWHYYGN
jgi:hypothetical protein